MNSHCEEFFNSISEISNGSRESGNKVIMEWLPEKPPVTILFSAIGYRLAEDFDCIDIQSNRELFTLIEEGVGSNDLLLSTAVTTGLIEGMVTRAQQIEGLWERMASSLGQRSFQHAMAWSNG